ncbi:MAG: hypothetical protein GX221_08595 [Candidatus Riflebacteria bacterium]|nr:hypothetical protein [Candidatus Riflebacteria bacterium]
MKIRVSLFVLLVLLSLPFSSHASADRNMLPRFPEIVFKLRNSASLSVTELKASADIGDSKALSEIEADFKNVSDSKISGEMKIRVLYPVSERDIKIFVDGKKTSYSPDRMRKFFLDPGKSMKIKINAESYTKYSAEAVRKALSENHKDRRNRKREDTFKGSFARFFKGIQKYENRFMTGNIVSNLGLFPLSVDKCSLVISVPLDYIAITPNEEAWTKKREDKKLLYISASNDAYNSLTLMPEKEKESFLQTRELMKNKH